MTDSRSGITRQKGSDGTFVYRHTDGSLISDPETLARIRSLAVPPAWTDVWICPSERGHIQATGRDARGRKQYRYHARWREVRDLAKYDHMVAFGEVLPRLREQVLRDLQQTGMPRTKVLAAIVRLLEETRIRVGNEEYRRQNRSFGLTTLRNRQATVTGATIRFEFRGKSGKQHRVVFSDRRLAGVVRKCQELPGQELFQFVQADGTLQSIDSEDVNAYIREASGGHFTAKDFRTWSGTVFAARFLRQCEACTSEVEARRQVARVIEQVADQLGNTPAVCRKSYVHPAVLDAYQAGTLGTSEDAPSGQPTSSYAALSADEQFVLDLLRSMADAQAACASLPAEKAA